MDDASFSHPEESKWQGVASSKLTGAIFFGVSRGKISEGIDFKDFMARAVISISIPYPNARCGWSSAFT